MNPGIGQELGETSRGFIAALKDQPALLVLSVVCIVLLSFMFFVLWQNSKAWTDVNNYRIEVGKEMLAYVRDTSQLLARCSIISPEQLPQPPKPP